MTFTAIQGLEKKTGAQPGRMLFYTKITGDLKMNKAFFSEFLENEIYERYIKEDFLGSSYIYDSFNKTILNDKGFIVYNAGSWAPSFDEYKTDLKGRILAKLLSHPAVQSLMHNNETVIEDDGASAGESVPVLVEAVKKRRGRPPKNA